MVRVSRMCVAGGKCTVNGHSFSRQPAVLAPNTSPVRDGFSIFGMQGLACCRSQHEFFQISLTDFKMALYLRRYSIRFK